MFEARPAARGRRRRRTRPVLSDIVLPRRWWAAPNLSGLDDGSPQPPGRHLKVVFPQCDPLDRVNWARHGLILLALLMPLVFIARIDGARDAVVQMFQTPRALASEFLAQGRTTEAVAPLREAMARHPGDPALLRQMAVALAATAPGEARRCFNQLDKLNATTDADRAHHSVLLAHLQDLAGARALLSKVSLANRAEPVTQQAWLEVWKAAGDYSSAADALTRLMDASAEVDLGACLEVLEAAAKAPITAQCLGKVEAAVVKGLSLCMKSGKASAIETTAPRLASLVWHDPAARLEVARALRSLPGNPAEFRLAAVRLSFPAVLDATSRASLRQSLMEEINSVGGLSAEEKDHAAAYLQKQSEHELVVELISAPEAVTDYPLYMRRTDSLLALGRWRDVGTMCANPAAPNLLQSRQLSQSLIAICTQSPQPLQVEHLLMTALSEARDEKRTAACFTTGCAALDHHLPNIACEAFAAALDLSSDRHSTLETIINTSRHGLLNVALLLGSLDATDAVRDDSVQNQLIYLNLLAGRDVDTMHEIIRNRRSLAPDETYLRFLEAFALHLHGDLAQAAQLLVPLPRYRWHQGEAAIIATIVAAAGNIDRSAGLLSQISVSDLFSEERSLVEPWKLRLAMSPQLISKVDRAAGQ